MNTYGAGSFGSAQFSAALLPKKYKWYPNHGIASPMCNKAIISPSPKKVSNSFFRRGSAAVPNNPYTRVSGQYPPLMQQQLLNLKPTSTNKAVGNFAECVEGND